MNLNRNDRIGAYELDQFFLACIYDIILQIKKMFA